MTRIFTRVGAVAIAVAALGAASAVTVSASARETKPTHSADTGGSEDAGGFHSVTCHSGDVLTGFYGTVTIPSGNFCELLQATVVGDVVAQSGAIQLGIDNSQITGSVFATHITDNGWICGSRIHGSVDITKSASNPETANSPGLWDIGFADHAYCGATSFDPVPGNAIGGSLQFNNNASGAAIANNDVEKNLACAGNVPAPVGTNNQVDKTASGQCVTLAGGVDNDTTNPGDND
jgi:hypothetical protein